MKTRKRLIMSSLALLMVVAVFGKDFKTVTFNVPQMVCENCEKKVKDNMRFEKGVKEILTDIPKKTVTITYDADKTDVEKLKQGFKKFKYDVTCSNDAGNCDKEEACGEQKKSCCDNH